MPTITYTAAKAVHPLAPAVLRQLGYGDEAVQSSRDAARHGADGGFHGFIATADCVAFYKRNKETILNTFDELSQDTGVSMSDMLKSFRCLKDIDQPIKALLIGPKHEDYDTVANALAWFALEEVGNAVLRAEEE